MLQGERRLSRAHELLNDELLNEAWDTVRESLVKAIERDPNNAEPSYGLAVLAKVRRELENVLKHQQIKEFYSADKAAH